MYIFWKPKLYYVRAQCNFPVTWVSSISFSLNSLLSFLAKVWCVISSKITEYKSIKQFKINIRNWEPNECHYKLYQPFISQVDYINTRYLRWNEIKRGTTGLVAPLQILNCPNYFPGIDEHVFRS